MRQCCRCNGSGRCKNCSCVKAGKACIDCLPNKRQVCLNQPTQPPLAQPLSLPSSANPSTSLSLSPSTAEGGMQLVEPKRLLDLMPTTEHSSNSIADGLTCVGGLPNFEPPANPKFTWRDMDSTSFTRLLDSAYDETVHWKKNCFKIPQGNAGKSFAKELARLFQAFATGSALASVALKAATVLPLLVLQKSHRNSKTKDHITCLER